MSRGPPRLRDGPLAYGRSGGTGAAPSAPGEPLTALSTAGPRPTASTAQDERWGAAADSADALGAALWLTRWELRYG
jgi:hypothetical protein